MNKTNKALLASALTVVSLASASSASAANQTPRGAEVGSLAGNCRIGTFPQTSKAGPYNVLCNIMEDSEKCLAFIKGHFSFDGTSVIVDEVNSQELKKAEYCLDVLKKDLGI